MAEKKTKKERKKKTEEKPVKEPTKEEEKPKEVEVKLPRLSANFIFLAVLFFAIGFFVSDAMDINFIGGMPIGHVVNSTVTTTTNPSAVTTTITPLSSKPLNAIVLNDKRCLECVTVVQSLLTQLETLFPEMNVEELDYGSNEGKDLYNTLSLKYLPALLFDDSVKDSANYNQVGPYMEKKGDYISLRIGANFDPTAEICDNGIDDTGNGKVDCEDESCKNHPACMETVCNDGKDDEGDGLIDCDDPDCEHSWVCMPKKEKPEVELFVMSHCPYGTQMEKGILPVAELLGDKIDFTVKFCSYAMHDKTELDEQLNQYCVQKEFSDKYLEYLRCFLKEGKSDECITEVGIDKEKLGSCIQQADSAYKITENYNDKSTWLNGRFPIFDIHKKENEKYGITGSPGLVINGVVASVGRDPASLLDAICLGFKEKPDECNEKLSSSTPNPGFGFSGSVNPDSSAASGTC